MTARISIPAKTVVCIALAAEGFLAGAALIWIHLRSLPFPALTPQWLPGAAAAVPLLALNFLLLRLACRGKWPALRHLLEDAIVPLCSRLGPFSAAVVALCAGIGEELFFRAALNVELSLQLGYWAGISVSSFIFAAVHFLGQLKFYRQLIVLYFAIGIYFSLLVSWQQSLVPAIVCHALYDYAAILYVRYWLADAQPGSGDLSSGSL